MNRKALILLVIVLISAASALSQQAQLSVSGKVLDQETKKPLPSASISLISPDGSQKYFTMTNKYGDFSLDDVKPGEYNLKITYIGYDTTEKKLRISRRTDPNLGEFTMKQSEVTAQGIEVTAQAPIGDVKNDTTEFNAGGFKTLPDATTEDLVKKMPGVQVESDGKVKAQGEEVKKVLVDGKPFFGDDPTLALRNMPAEVVDKIQIFDKMSDQAEFTGFDDGNSSKAMNIITKRNRRNGQFGKMSGGYGYQDKYSASLNLNLFSDVQRISILGMTNNVNQQNFSIQDILDVMGSSSQPGPGFRFMQGRGGGGFGGSRPPGPPSGGGERFFKESGIGDMMVGQLEGISTTHAFGLNYNNTFSDNFELTGSYFFNYTHNDNDQNLDRQYLLSTNNGQTYLQDNTSGTRNINHRFNFKLNYQADSSNSFIFRPTISIQNNNLASRLSSEYLQLGIQPVNSSASNYSSNYDGYNFSGDLLWRHKFSLPGRTLSINFTGSANDKNGGSNLFTENRYNQDNLVTLDTVNQLGNSPVKGYGLSANTVYTEPLGTSSQLQVSYNISFNNSNSDRETYNYNNAEGLYNLLDSLLSNTFDNDYLTNRFGIGYRLRDENSNLSLSLDYQRADLKSDQKFPFTLNNSYKFENLLPSARFTYKFSQTMNLMLNYRASTNAPSISQLQNVIDNRNPLQLSTGNPSLKQQYSHFLMGRLSNFGSGFTNVFMAFMSLNYRTDYIANATYIAQQDTLINGSQALPAGGQLTIPVNADGYWNASIFSNYGFPLEFISTNANVNMGFTYSRSPSFINNLKNFSNSYNFNVGFMLSSNISQNLDFNIFSRANFAVTKNSIWSDKDNKYNNFLNSINLNWIIWEGLFFQAEVRNQIYTGLASSSNSNSTLLNLSIGKKIFENNSGEIKLSVFDVLKQNQSYQTNVTDYYIEYSQNKVLQQYVMLTFSYNLRRFEDKKSPGEFR